MNQRKTYVATEEQKLTGQIISERARQQSDEGWTPEHDQDHDHGELLRAALTYLTGDMTWWPWNNEPKLGARDRIKAGALILAELDRQKVMPKYFVGARIRFPLSGHVYNVTAVDGDQVTFAFVGDPEDSTTESVADLDGIDVEVLR